MSLRSAVIFFALASATAAQAKAEPREPTGKWNVNFADAQCVAHRDYGTPAKPLRLILKAPAVGDVVQVAVRQEASAGKPEQAKVTVTLDGGAPLKTSMLMFTPKGSRERLYLLNMPLADFAAVGRSKTLSLRSDGLNETFALSGIEPLMKVVDECVADLRLLFNVGAIGEQPTKFRRRARGNLAKFFSSDDYPAVSVMKGESGRVGFGLLIAENGQIADCTIVSTSGVPALDSQACALLKTRARLEPAISLDGKPAKDSVVGGIVWRLP
jgi:TonB family protein